MKKSRTAVGYCLLINSSGTESALHKTLPHPLSRLWNRGVATSVRNGPYCHLFDKRYYPSFSTAHVQPCHPRTRPRPKPRSQRVRCQMPQSTINMCTNDARSHQQPNINTIPHPRPSTNDPLVSTPKAVPTPPHSLLQEVSVTCPNPSASSGPTRTSPDLLPCSSNWAPNPNAKSGRRSARHPSVYPSERPSQRRHPLGAKTDSAPTLTATRLKSSPNEVSAR